MAKEEKSSVERLKGRLYARDGVRPKEVPERTPLSHETSATPVSWTHEEVPETHIQKNLSPLRMFQSSAKRMSFATKFLLGAILFFLAAVATAIAMFYGGGNIVSSRNIELEVVVPSLSDGGEEVQLQIVISNSNRTSLRLADLILDYPDGTRDPKDPTRSLSHERLSIGTIESGQEVKKTTSAVFFGREGTQQNIHATLEYTIAGSNAIFVKEADASFLIGSSPVSLSVDAPSEAIAGEPFDMTLTVQSNAEDPVEHIVVEAQYPFGFSFLGSDPKADVGGLLWRLGTLQPGKSKVIRLTGVVDASEGDERIVRFLIGADPDETNSRIRVPFLSEPVTITVKKPLIAGTISVDGKTGKTISASAGKVLQGTVSWENNLAEAISDLELTLAFSGPMLDTSSIGSQNGFYQSKNSTIIWTKDQDPSLARVAPGERGAFYFTFGTLVPGEGSVLYSNPTVTLQLIARGVREGGESLPVSSTVSTQVTFASAVELSAQASQGNSIFDNFGPHPPKIETETSYTILWSVKNPSNAIAQASVAAILPPYVEFIQAQSNSGITYDKPSRTVRWSLGDVAAGVGYSAPARQGAFQVVITPSSSQIGQAPALTGSALFSGQDRFAQIAVQASAAAPTTGRTVE